MKECRVLLSKTILRKGYYSVDKIQVNQLLLGQNNLILQPLSLPFWFSEVLVVVRNRHRSLLLEHPMMRLGFFP